MPESGTKTPLGGTVIVQIFVQRSGYQVLNGLSDGVRSESSAEALSKACRAASIVPWMAERLSYASSGAYTG